MADGMTGGSAMVPYGTLLNLIYKLCVLFKKRDYSGGTECRLPPGLPEMSIADNFPISMIKGGMFYLGIVPSSNMLLIQQTINKIVHGILVYRHNQKE